MSAALVTGLNTGHVIAVITTFVRLPAWSHVKDVIQNALTKMIRQWLHFSLLCVT